MDWRHKLYHEVRMEAVRSRGPGGQNINRVSSCILLRWAPAKSKLFSPEELNRLISRLASRTHASGDIIVKADEFRDQPANRKAALNRLIRMIDRALFVPKKRRPTRPTKASREKRISSKKSRGQTKQLRQKVRHD